MKVNTSHLGEFAVVEIDGEVDAEHVAFLKKALQPLKESALKGIALNMTRVPFIDSTGLGILISLMRQVKEQGKKLRLVGLSDEVRSIFEITRLHKVFDLSESVEKAIQEMR